MANKIVQYRYPYDIPSSFSKCRLGISISEDEFMQLNSSSGIDLATKHIIPEPYQGFSFDINGETIYMGKTCMYETDEYIDINSFSLNTTTPKTILVQVIYKQ